MSKTLLEIAQQLKDSGKKIQLIYAFNGTGKTRLSRLFKNLVAPKQEDEEGVTRKIILYYNAFTEDLFYWNNDLESGAEPKLKIQPNTFTDWVLREQGQDRNVITKFQHYTNSRINPEFSPDFSEVVFSLLREDGNWEHNLKISKGEESNFIWSIFFVLLEQVIEVLNIAEPEERGTSEFDDLKYIFIDDPVSSLDENHLIELAVDLAALIRRNTGLKFIITTHNPLFYNVLYNELKLKSKKNRESAYLLKKHKDGAFDLEHKQGDSNRAFTHHLYLKQLIRKAIDNDTVQRHHFTFLRNLYEKTASFLGYENWSELLPDEKQTYYTRIVNFTSHSTLSNEAVAEPSPQEKKMVEFLLNHLLDKHKFYNEQKTSTSEE